MFFHPHRQHTYTPHDTPNRTSIAKLDRRIDRAREDARDFFESARCVIISPTEVMIISPRGTVHRDLIGGISAIGAQLTKNDDGSLTVVRLSRSRDDIILRAQWMHPVPIQF